MERSGGPVEREFLLFSDCLIWLAPSEQTSTSWDWSWSGSGNSASGPGNSQSHISGSSGNDIPDSDARPTMARSRSKSEAELPTLRTVGNEPKVSPSTPASPIKMIHRRSHYHAAPAPPPPNMGKRTSSTDDKWLYKGRIELVDMDVVVGSALEDERRLEVLSPEGSFALYAGKQSRHIFA